MHVLSEVQATVLEEAGKPEKALEELAKKEGKIVCLSSCCGWWLLDMVEWVQISDFIVVLGTVWLDQSSCFHIYLICFTCFPVVQSNWSSIVFNTRAKCFWHAVHQLVLGKGTRMGEKCPASLLCGNQCCVKMCNLRFVVGCWIRWTSWVFENTVHRCICKWNVWVMLRRPIGSYLMWTLIITSMILLSKWSLLSSALCILVQTHSLFLKI